MNRKLRFLSGGRRAVVALAAAAIASVSLIAVAPPAASQGMCLPTRDVATRLKQTFGEVPSAGGLTEDGNLLQVYASIEGQSWTLVLTTPSGVSCVLAAGESWNPAVKPVQDTGL